jgi:hypothetical protein
MSFLDLTDVEVTFGDFTPIPAGDYHVCVEDSVVKSSSTGGKYLAVTFKVIEGDHEGRKVFHNFNIENKNPEAVRIALEEIKRLLFAAGIPEKKHKMDTPSALCGLDLMIKVAIAKNEKTGDDKNVVKRFLISKEMFETIAPKTKTKIKEETKTRKTKTADDEDESRRFF